MFHTYYHSKHIHIVNLDISFGIDKFGENDFWKHNTITTIHCSAKYGKLIGLSMVRDLNINYLEKE